MRLVEADALKYDIQNKALSIFDVESIIDVSPSIDAALVVHGRWRRKLPQGYYCSKCKSTCLMDNSRQWKLSHFCPNCGAKMDSYHERKNHNM